MTVEKTQEIIQTIDVTPDKDGGVIKEIIQEGTGDEYPLTGDKVSVHYVGTLQADGSQFDSSRDREDKFEFKLGKGEVIKSWDYGVATMKRGELCRLICQSKYAYGETGSPPKIPPNSCLIFEVELFDWNCEDLSSKKDGGIIRRIIRAGQGVTTPNEEALVDVHLVGKVNGSVFDTRELKFTLGEGSEHNIPSGVEKALESCNKGEKCIIKLTPKYAFGSLGVPSLNIPPNANVEYEIELKEFEKAKESWEMSQEEKIEQAKLYKSKGTDHFKQQKYKLAAKQYKKVTELMEYDSGLSDDLKEENHSLHLAGHLNLSMCYLKMNSFLQASDHACKVIEKDASNVKAFFRRGQSMLALEDADKAKKDFEKVLELDATNKAAASQLQLCNARINQQKQKEKQLYGGMFEKFAKADSQKAAANRAKNDVMSGDLGEWKKSEANRENEDDKGSDDEEEGYTKKDFENLNNVEMI